MKYFCIGTHFFRGSKFQGFALQEGKCFLEVFSKGFEFLRVFDTGFWFSSVFQQRVRTECSPHVDFPTKGLKVLEVSRQGS